MKAIDMSTVVYVLIMILVFMSATAFGQIKVIQFNAEWNKTNQVPWVQELKDCKTISFIDIGKNADDAKKHKIAVIPTIIIFKDGEEVARFQADLSLKMVATREEIQEEIDGPIHALSIHTFTENEWIEKNKKAEPSPNCLGGSKNDN